MFYSKKFEDVNVAFSRIVKVCRDVYGEVIKRADAKAVKATFSLEKKILAFNANRRYQATAVVFLTSGGEERIAVCDLKGNVGLFRRSDFAKLTFQN